MGRAVSNYEILSPATVTLRFSYPGDFFSLLPQGPFFQELYSFNSHIWIRFEFISARGAEYGSSSILSHGETRLSQHRFLKILSCAGRTASAPSLVSSARRRGVVPGAVSVGLSVSHLGGRTSASRPLGCTLPSAANKGLFGAETSGDIFLSFPTFKSLLCFPVSLLQDTPGACNSSGVRGLLFL